jgi:hypothetical protein
MDAGIAVAVLTAAWAAVTVGEAAAADADGALEAPDALEVELELAAELHAASARTAAAKPTPVSLLGLT